jgi:hypothetical protein
MTHTKLGKCWATNAKLLPGRYVVLGTFFDFLILEHLSHHYYLLQRTDNAIKNHWNSSICQKIEKYLAKKQGVDEANIKYTEDGKYGFMGDLEGVLAAIQGGLGEGKKIEIRSGKN